MSGFQFPDENQPQRRKEWIEQVGRPAIDGKMWKPTKNSRICMKHFGDDAFERNVDDQGRIRKRFKLKPRARPTKYLREPPPQISNLQIEKMQREIIKPGPPGEHSYAQGILIHT